MGAAFVQKAKASVGLAGAASVTATFGAGVGSGNLVVGTVTSGDTTSTNFPTAAQIVDNHGVQATAVIDHLFDVNGPVHTATFYFKNVTNGLTSVTFTPATSTGPVGIEMHEVSGLDTVSPLDVHGINNPASSTTIDTPTVTTTANGEYVYGSVWGLTSGFSDVNSVAGTGASPILENADNAGGGGFQLGGDAQAVQATAGAVHFTFTLNIANAYLSAIATFKAPAGGAVPALARPIIFTPYVRAPFLNRFPPTTSPPPIIPPGVPVELSEPIRFKPVAKAPFLNRLQPVTPPVTSVTVFPGFGSIVLQGFPPTSIGAGTPPALYQPITLDVYKRAPFLNRLQPPPPLAAYPYTASIVLNGFAPSLSVTVVPGFGSIVLNGFSPAAIGAGTPVALKAPIQLRIYKTAPLLAQVQPATAATGTIAALPGFGSLILTGPAPALSLSVVPGTASLLLTGFAPITRPIPATASLLLSGFAPITRPVPNAAALLLTGFPPTVSNVSPGAGGGRILTTMSARIISGS